MFYILLTQNEKTNLIETLYSCKSFNFEKHTLSSGKISPYYIDLRLLQSDIQSYKFIIDIYLKLINFVGVDSFDYVCGVASSGLVFSPPISLKIDKPHIYVRKSQKKYGRQKNLEGSISNNSRILLIDDVFTSGSSLLESIDIIYDSGGIISNAIVLIDRLETHHSIFSKSNVNLISALSIFDIANILNSRSLISLEQKNLMLNEIKV